jgi:hypothetical protein
MFPFIFIFFVLCVDVCQSGGAITSSKFHRISFIGLMEIRVLVRQGAVV